MDHPLDKLHDHFFDRLPPEERGSVQAHLSGCAACAARLDGLAAAVHAVPPAEPSAALLSRLLGSVDHIERFAPFAPRLAELVALSANDARRALHALSDVDSWPPGPYPGMRAQWLPPGAARAHVMAILACFAPGASVPRHRHCGHEVILVFQGAFETEDGRVVAAGEELHSPPGSSHTIPRILGDVDCLCVIVNDGPVESDEGEQPEPPRALDACPGGTP